MRLTLRTLLAYLDDVLEPAQTKLIGQKIQESAVAGKLVSLIRTVVRQRRLKAPSVSGPNSGIDPNVVAQYLDNTLAPEQVVEVETVLLTSDELLAEVASCHQVMALMMGKPSEVSEASREKLYALGPVDQADQLHVDEARVATGGDAGHGAAGVASNGRDGQRQRDSDRHAETSKPAHAEIPEYLRQSSWSQRAAPTAIIALLIVVCVGLLISDPGFLTGIREAKRELTNSERDPAKPGVPGVKTPPVVADANLPADDAGIVRNEIASVESPAATDRTPSTIVIPASPAVPGIDPPPPADATPIPDGDMPADAAVAVRTTPSATVAVPGKSALPVSPLPDSTVPNNEPKPVLNPALVQYISSDGVTLRFDDAQQNWFLLPRRSAVAPGELLAVLEPFEAVLDIDRGGMIATVMGDSAVRLLPPDRSTTVGLDVRRGRVLLRSSRKDVAQCPVMTVQVGSDSWWLEFLSADTVCTLEISPREPLQFEKPLGANWYAGVVRVLSGSVKWTATEGQSQQVNAESALGIMPRNQDAGVQPVPVSSTYAPEWTDAQKRKQSPLRRFAALFEKEFELDQPVGMTLLSLIKHSNAKIVELAVRGLSLTESYSGMVQALAECSYEEGRFAARDGIRAWLPQQADRGLLLKQLLEQYYPPTDAKNVYMLLWGFRMEDGTNRAISLELINSLKNTRVEIRELAYFWIVQLSGRKWEFRATDVAARRDSAVRRLESHVASVGALVKPTEKDASPK
jgi:hypothetical protein